MSASHANRGKAFESTLDSLHAVYAQQGRASVIRTPPNLSILRRQPSQRKLRSGALLYDYVCQLHAEGPPDYVAQANGRSFLFDAKSCEGRRWNFSDLPPHQAARFDQHARHGAIPFVLLRAGTVWLLPWRELGPAWRAWAPRAARAA